MDSTNCTETSSVINKSASEPQCQFYVVRKKRLCRMTVRPGRRYCGEHDPRPRADDCQDDSRIPCPYDPKHTCYASKLQKHLTVCNARGAPAPPYIQHNVNAPEPPGPARRPLADVPPDLLQHVINKVNTLYDNFIQDELSALPELPIHEAVLQEFSEAGRAESSRRHLRQTSSLLHAAEAQGLVQDLTCYVELGAGKGQLSYYACAAWCAPGRGSRVLLVDRASLRHKRDNRLRGALAAAAARLRADLAHLALHRVPDVLQCAALVGLAKHLCGVATDYALRCLTAPDVGRRARGAVLATCCHHRCARGAYVGGAQLQIADHVHQELGVTGDELDVILGIVSWATCGDGRSRASRAVPDGAAHCTARRGREQTGRRAKALLDWGRVLFMRARGFEARLCHYVPAAVSPENLCIVARRVDS